MIYLAIYAAGWLVTIPFTLNWHMKGSECTLGDDCQRASMGQCSSEPHQKPRGEFRARNTEDYLSSALWALLWPLFAALGVIFLAFLVAFSPAWLIGKLTPRTKGEKQREAREREERIRTRAEEIARLERDVFGGTA